MPIPNISTLYKRIGHGAEGGLEFARFCKLLLLGYYEKQQVQFVSESDASGDFRSLDGYIVKEDKSKIITGFHFKFYPDKPSPTQQKNMVDAIVRSLGANKNLTKLILITPEDYMKEEQEWFASLKDRFEQYKEIEDESGGLFVRFSLEHWGHSRIIQLILKNEELGKRYFPELFPQGSGSLKLASFNINRNICRWENSKNNPNTVYWNRNNMDSSLVEDPVLDVQLKNSTNEVLLLNKMELHVEKIWTQLRGLPRKYLLKSIGLLEWEIDLNQPINMYNFDDPVILKPSIPLRFDLQFLKFIQNAPGNFARIRVEFHFDNGSMLVTDSITFSF